MITSLSIKNFLLIESALLTFDKGFTVITGESGSGKSLIFKAIRFCFGGRLDRSYIGQWSNQLTVSICYQLTDRLKQELAYLDFPQQESIEIVHSMSSEQRLCLINGKRVKQSDLKEIMNLMLLDSQQSQQVKLGDPIIQRGIIDQLLPFEYQEGYQHQYQEYVRLGKILDDNQKLLSKQDDLEWLEYQINELTKLDCQPETIFQLQQIIDSHKCFQDLWALWQKDACHYQQVDSSIKRLQQLLPQQIHQELHEYFDQAMISNQELVAQIESYISEVSDPSNLAKATKEIGQLKEISRKHRIPLDQLAEYLEDLKSRYRRIIDAQEQSEQIERSVQQAYQQLLLDADQLQELRVQKSNDFIKKVSSQLLFLGLDQAELKIEWAEQPLDLYGRWTPIILIKSNPGQPFKALDQCLSGGELSRLNLLFTINHHQDQVLLLDEVDTGISGKMGAQVRSMLLDLSKATQVMCISHIVQVAQGGQSHFKVSKFVTGSQTNAKVELLNDQGRTQELERMSCSDEITV